MLRIDYDTVKLQKVSCDVIKITSQKYVIKIASQKFSTLKSSFSKIPITLLDGRNKYANELCTPTPLSNLNKINHFFVLQ